MGQFPDFSFTLTAFYAKIIYEKEANTMCEEEKQNLELAEEIAENEMLSEEVQPKKTPVNREEKWLIVLLSIACVLCLGIIGVLTYWLEFYLKL